jgi:hypothetical protein
MTTAEYRAADAVNFSSLKHILRSPAHYRAALEEDRKETPAMILGTLTHAVCLEGQKLSALTAIKPPGMNLATKEGKAWKESSAGRTIISDEDAQDIVGMMEQVQGNPHAAAMLKACQRRETPVFGDIRGVASKCLLDAHGTDGVDWVICDLKTTDDASPEGFARKVESLHYDMQAAMYCYLLGLTEQAESRPHWYWIVVEKKPPYTCAVYSSNEWLTSGERKLEKALERLKECRESGEWPHPWQGINELPRWRWAGNY